MLISTYKIIQLRSSAKFKAESELALKVTANTDSDREVAVQLVYFLLQLTRLIIIIRERRDAPTEMFRSSFIHLRGNTRG